MPNKSDFIGRARATADDLIRAVNNAGEVLTERSRLDYDTVLVDGDFAGQSDVTAATFNASLDTIAAVLTGITEDQKRALYQIKN